MGNVSSMFHIFRSMFLMCRRCFDINGFWCVCARNKRVLIGMLSRVFEVLRIRVEMLLESYHHVTLRHPPPSRGHPYMGGLVLGGLVLHSFVYYCRLT
jgi:hypothetical protein